MSGYKKLFKDTTAITIGNFASKLLIFFMLPFYTHVLSTEEYGLADLVFTTTSLLFPIFTCLASEYVLRFSLDEKEDKKKVFTSAILVWAGGLLLMILISPVIDAALHFGPIIYLYLLYYLSYTLNDIFAQFAKGLNNVKLFSVGGCISTVVIVICNLLFLLVFKIGIYGYLLSYIFGLLAAALFYFFALKFYKYFSIASLKNSGGIKRYLSYSMPMIPNSIGWWVNNSLDKYILVFFWGASITGIYAAGYKISSLLTVVSGVFISAWQLSAVKDFGSDESKTFYSNVYAKYSLFVLSLASFIILLVKPISSVLLAKDFYVAWQFAGILVFAYIFQTMSSFLGTLYTSSKKTKMLFVSTLLGAAINAAMNFLLIPNMGAVGAAIATAVSYFFVWLFRLIHTRLFIMKFKARIAIDCLSYLSLASVLVSIYFEKSYSLFLGIGAFVLILVLHIRDIKDVAVFVHSRLAKHKER